MSKKNKEKTVGMGAMLYFADLGYTQVTFNFSGAGDDGSMDDPIFLKKDEKESDVDYKEFSERRKVMDSNVLEKFTDNINTILGDIEDWWNNDGGQGEITIQIPSGKYEIDVGINYTKTTDYHHEGTLTDQ